MRVAIPTAILILLTAVFVSDHGYPQMVTGGGGWRASGDGRSYRPAIGAGRTSAMTQVICPTPEYSPGVIAYSVPVGQGCACEGRMFAVVAGGIQCVVTEAP